MIYVRFSSLWKVFNQVTNHTYQILSSANWRQFGTDNLNLLMLHIQAVVYDMLQPLHIYASCTSSITAPREQKTKPLIPQVEGKIIALLPHDF